MIIVGRFAALAVVTEAAETKLESVEAELEKVKARVGASVLGAYGRI